MLQLAFAIYIWPCYSGPQNRHLEKFTVGNGTKYVETFNKLDSKNGHFFYEDLHAFLRTSGM
jgi:hypothetical protein